MVVYEKAFIIPEIVSDLCQPVYLRAAGDFVYLRLVYGSSNFEGEQRYAKSADEESG